MDDAVTTQHAAIDAVLDAYDHAGDAATAFTTTLRENVFPANTEQLALFARLRAATRTLCETAQAFRDTCDAAGPDPRVWAGATPPRELWAAAAITTEPGFFDRLDTWNSASAAVLSGNSDDDPGHDPAQPITAACSRAKEFLVDKHQDAFTAAAEQLAAGPLPITVETGITPGGGRSTTINFARPSDQPADDADVPPRHRYRPQWWQRRQDRREAARRFRTVDRWIRRALPVATSPHNDALAVGLHGWTQLAPNNPLLTQSWYACHFLTAHMRGLGYQATMYAVDLEFRDLDPDDALPMWGRPLDPSSPPNAVIVLPDITMLFDPLGGKSFHEPDTEPVLLTIPGTVRGGDTFTTTLGDRTLTYTLSDHTPHPTDHHRQSCRAIDDMLEQAAQHPNWNRYRNPSEPDHTV